MTLALTAAAAVSAFVASIALTDWLTRKFNH